MSTTNLPARQDGAPAAAAAEVVSAADVALLRPIASAAELVKARGETGNVIAEALQEGRDYGTIPGTDRPTLYKAGAETIAAAFGCRPEFEIIDREVDHHCEVHWVDKDGRKRTSLGLYRFQVRCRLINRASGKTVGEGLGACSTLESKYIRQPRNVENTALKMATKRAFVAGVLHTFGLSDRFSEARPSTDALRGKYHATVNELLEAETPERRAELRHAFQRAHRDLPDSSAEWGGEDFITAIETLGKYGREAFDRALRAQEAARAREAEGEGWDG